MRTRRISAKALAFLAVTVAGVLFYVHYRGVVPRKFGTDVFRVMEQAEQVEVYRIAQDPAQPPRSFEDIRMAGPPVVPGPAWTGRLRSVVGSPLTYGWPGEFMKACLPRPGVAVRFVHRGTEVHLLLCFECDMLSLARAGQMKWKVFDPARGRLVRLVKQVFPDDPVIQGLPEQRK